MRDSIRASADVRIVSFPILTVRWCNAYTDIFYYIPTITKLQTHKLLGLHFMFL